MQTDLSCGDGFTLAHHGKHCSPILSLYWMTALHLKGPLSHSYHRSVLPARTAVLLCTMERACESSVSWEMDLKAGLGVFFSELLGTSTLFKTQKLVIIQDLLFFRNQTSATGTVIRQVQVVALVNLQAKMGSDPIGYLLLPSGPSHWFEPIRVVTTCSCRSVFLLRIIVLLMLRSQAVTLQGLSPVIWSPSTTRGLFCSQR